MTDFMRPPLRPALEKVLIDIRDKRERQIHVHGWTLQHDSDEHSGGELAQAAIVHLQTAFREVFHLADEETTIWWPWDETMPAELQRRLFAQTKREALINAVALLVAELELLDLRA